SVGVALLLPLAIHVWRLSAPLPCPLPQGRGDNDSSPAPLRRERVARFARKLWLFPLACWGLFAYMLYLYVEFGEPLAFAKTQENWRMRPAVPLAEKVVDLVTLEPVWSIFDPSSPCYWAGSSVEFSAFFSLHLANPIYWLLAIVLVIVGACKRWLT